MQFIVYDFEVFAKDWLVVFKKGEEIDVIANDVPLLQSYYDKNKTDIFVGFNNKHYDDYIFKGIMAGFNPKRISDFIIEKGKQGWEYPGMPRTFINTLDIKQDIVGGLGLALKEAEGNMGINIEESTIDFRHEEKLTVGELQEVAEYCKHDVTATEKILVLRQEDVKTRIDLLKAFNLPISNIGLTNAKITAVILDAKMVQRNDELLYDFPDNLKVNNPHVLSLFDKVIDYDNTLTIDLCGVEHTIAYGGLHGAKKGTFEGNIWNVDVSSYYPSLMIQYDYNSRSISEKGKQRFKEVYDTRMKLKAAGKKKEQLPYKLILNTTYGAMKNKYNPLYDPKQANQVCISGQLFLIDLIEKLEPYIELLQSNTDGLIFISRNDEKVTEVLKEWQSRTRMKLDIDKVSKIWQKDVNNYIMLQNNKLKVKGGYVKDFAGGTYISNTTTILDRAIVDYLVSGTSVEETIMSCNELMPFQYICKRGPTYLRVEQDGIVVNNCNRVFASKDVGNGNLYKVKEDGRKDSIAGLPNHCVIVNDSLDTTSFSVSDIDKKWYINQAIERIKDFLEE